MPGVLREIAERSKPDGFTDQWGITRKAMTIDPANPGSLALVRELLAELLPLQEEAAKDKAMQKRVAHLFLVADSPSRGAEALRDLVRQHPTDADAYAGLG